MNDRELSDRTLLELAAKAAGIDNFVWYENQMHGHAYPCLGHVTNLWNPLTDDGDALRLAVKLKMTLGVGVARGDAGEQGAFDEPCDYAATRRAIVRAAAEIGKGMT